MRRVVSCLLLMSLLSAVVAATNPMDREAVIEDAQRIWSQQSSDVFVPKHGGVYVAGVYVWHGRADQDYKAFHQWEVKLKAGKTGVKDVKLQVIPLDSEMKVQQLFRKKESPEHKVGDIAADGEEIISYKLNCSHITSYRIKLSWDGGAQELFAGTRFMLPIDAKALDKQPYLTVSDVDFKYKRSRRRAEVSFYLCNVGGGEASEVEHTIEFMDEKNKVIHSEIYKPEEGTVPAKYGKRQKVEYKKIKPFENVNIRTRQKQLLVYEIDGDQLVAKEDIGLSSLQVKDKQITGTITNGFKGKITGLTVTIVFEDDKAKVVKEVDVKIATLDAGASTDFTESIDKVFTFKAYGMSYEFEGLEE